MKNYDKLKGPFQYEKKIETFFKKNASGREKKINKIINGFFKNSIHIEYCHKI